MRIHELQKSKWLKDKARRKGRGNATGTGNYSGKGLKGQKSRSWFSMKPFFEWGQTSIVMRLPKARWFKRYYKLIKDVTIINLGTLDADERITDTMEITKTLLKTLWYIKSEKVCVKILSHGDYAKHLKFVDMDAISTWAQTKITTPGTVHSVAHKAPVKIVKVAKKSIKKAPATPKKAVAPVATKQEAPKKVAPKAVAKKVEAVKKPAKEAAAAPKKAVAKPTTKKAVTKKTK